MSKVLYIKANPKDEDKSLSLSIGREFINAYKKKNPDDEIIEVDVYKDEIPFLDKDVLKAWDKLCTGEGLTETEKNKSDKVNAIADKFISADKYVIASPVWSMSIPPMLKAYIDAIVIPGKTFEFVGKGPPVGLLKNKKLFHIQASGGVYSNSPDDMSNGYLKKLFGFLGVDSIETIFAEGVYMCPESSEEIKKALMEKAKREAGKF